MDTLHFHGIRLKTTLGVSAWEQHQPQPILINLTLKLPENLRAFEKDTLEDTIDYGVVVEDLENWLPNHRCQLIEYLAERIAQRIFQNFPVNWMKVEISKTATLATMEAVSVCIERQRPEQTPN